MISDTPGATTNDALDYIARLYPDGVHTVGATSTSQVPPMFTAAGAEDFYNDGVKPYCQLCHMTAGRPKWLSDPRIFEDATRDYACRGDIMPHGFITHRNIWVTGAVNFAFGCDTWQPPRSIIDALPPPNLPPPPPQCAVCPCTQCEPFDCECPFTPAPCPEC